MSKERGLLKELHRAVDCEWLDEIETVLAEPEQKPLTPQQISEGNQSMFNVTREAFVKGVKWAEQQHGIGGGE